MNLTLHPEALCMSKREIEAKAVDAQKMLQVKKHFRLAKAIFNGPLNTRRIAKMATKFGMHDKLQFSLTPTTEKK